MAKYHSQFQEKLQTLQSMSDSSPMLGQSRNIQYGAQASDDGTDPKQGLGLLSGSSPRMNSYQLIGEDDVTNSPVTAVTCRSPFRSMMGVTNSNYTPQ